MIGTALLLVMSTAIAAPLGVVIAVWLTEYGRPAGLARAVESAVEIVAGTPSIVLAMFGLVFFQQQWLGFLTFERRRGGARPLLHRRRFDDVPDRAAAGGRRHPRVAERDSRATSVRPPTPSARPRRRRSGACCFRRRAPGSAPAPPSAWAGSRATPRSSSSCSAAPCRSSTAPRAASSASSAGTGSTLTSYVYLNSPAGEGLAPEKAYFAAFVLMVLVILLNFVVTRLARGRAPQWTH